MMEADQDGDGKLSFGEFKDMVASTDIAKQMVRPSSSLFSPCTSLTLCPLPLADARGCGSPFSLSPPLASC